MPKGLRASKRPRDSHDAYFKWIMGVPRNADRFIRERLPGDVARLIADGPPVAIANSFVDGEMRRHLTDLLFVVRLVGGGELLVYVLLEHKSTPDRLTRLQLWRYMTRIWEWWLRKEAQGVPPLILPIVVHHGARPWPFPVEFPEMFGPFPAALEPFVPHFRHVLVDLVAIPDGELSADPALCAELLVLKCIQWPDLSERMEDLLVAVSILEEMALWAIFEYLSGRLGRKVLLATVERVSQRSDGEKMNEFREFVKEHYKAQGLAEGRAAGMVEGMTQGKVAGKAEGKAETLALLLTRRFGPLPDKVRRRIGKADLATLDGWLDRVLDAPDLDSVLAGRRKRPD